MWHKPAWSPDLTIYDFRQQPQDSHSSVAGPHSDVTSYIQHKGSSVGTCVHGWPYPDEGTFSGTRNFTFTKKSVSFQMSSFHEMKFLVICFASTVSLICKSLTAMPTCRVVLRIN